MSDPRFKELAVLARKKPYAKETQILARRIAADPAAVKAITQLAKRRLALKRGDSAQIARVKKARLAVVNGLDELRPAVMELDACNEDEPMTHDPDGGTSDDGVDWGYVIFVIGTLLLASL